MCLLCVSRGHEYSKRGCTKRFKASDPISLSPSCDIESFILPLNRAERLKAYNLPVFFLFLFSLFSLSLSLSLSLFLNACVKQTRVHTVTESKSKFHRSSQPVTEFIT